MDKYEYKVRADEIKSLIAEGEYAEAVKIADTIDWRRVRSVMMLCTVSDLYKINRRYQESKEILLMANDKRPSGRAIVYSLCELSIKMDDLIDAVKYYKEFVEIAPRDTGKYVLLYRLYEAQDVSLEERIAVLEEFKKRDYREKWAYELAYLYHRIGLTTKCIEECDEMYLWFGEGAYVLKALELKALHVPLNAEQQEKYDLWIRQRDEEIAEEEEEVQEDEAEETSEVDDKPQTDSYVTEDSVPVADKTDSDIMTIPTTELPEVKTVDVGQYNTINLQMVVAEGMKELMPEETEDIEPATEEEAQTQIFEKVPMEPETESEPEPEDQPVIEPEADLEIQQLTESELESTFSFEPETESEPQSVMEPEADLEIQQFTESELESSFSYEPETEPEPQPVIEPAAEFEPQLVLEPEPEPEPEYQFSFVSEPETEPEPEPQPVVEPEPVHNIIEHNEPPASIAEQLIAPLLQETAELPGIEPEINEETIETRIPETPEIYETPTVQEVPETNVRQGANWVRYDDVLSQEYDGQIRLVVPDEKVIEKQITGQLSIEDIMAEWEEMKRSNEQKRMEDVRKRILSRTGSLFADFDEATRNGLLEELEKAFAAAMMQESDRESAIKKVVYPSGIESKLNSEMKTKLQQAVADVASETAESMLSDEAEGEVLHTDDEVEELEEIVEPEETVESGESEKSQDFRSLRELTNEEQELFGRYAQTKKSKEQIVNTLDNMSMAAYTGNVIITGEDDGTTMPLAKNLIREMQYNDSNFSGKVAKISAAALNKKEIAETLTRLSNGALIIEKAADLNEMTITKLNKVLENENIGLLLILEDTRKRINNLLVNNESLTTCINLRIDIEPLDDEALVAYAKKYAEENEYSIDEFGVLALHTRIADMQTSDHEVSVSEVRELVDNAIYYANKKTPRHFLDILLAKRYDKEDMIILREMDFMHY
ncbi:MAG: hypothetical protein J1E98_07645 [Lachnospiraceae bacterium]|nr:hypothetical protein [Lachnospiraceae bacterium]